MLKLNKINESYYEVLVISNNKLVGNFIQDVDGFFYFSPTGEGGLWSDYGLLEIGTKLKELNKPWSDHIDEYFASEQNVNPDEELDLNL